MAKFRFKNRFHQYSKLFRAILSRTILIAHASLAIFITSKRLDISYLWFLLVTFVIETGLIIYFRNGLEWRRFCTCFLGYLLTVEPCLWLLRLNSCCSSSSISVNVTDDALATTHQPSPSSGLNILASAGNNSSINTAIALLASVDPASFLEQSMMFVLILVRWLLPRGLIDRKSLSQLLIMYCAIGADILDFSEIFDKLPKDVEYLYRYIVLAVSSWSRLQFTLVITTAFSLTDRKQVRRSVAHLDLVTQSHVEDNENKSELMSLLMVFFMQDGPFLVIRFWVLLMIGVQDYMIIFFFLKNILTLVLAVFRMLILCGIIAQSGDDLLLLDEAIRQSRMVELGKVEPTKGKGKSQKRGKEKKGGRERF